MELNLEQGKWIHGFAIRSAFEYDVFMCNEFVGMYAKCGDFSIPYELFERMPKQDFTIPMKLDIIQ